MKKRILGCDLGTYSVKFVELESDSRQWRFLQAGMFPSSPKAITSEATYDQEALASQLKKALLDYKVEAKFINIALPESKVFTRVIQTPALTDKELESAIKWEAEQYIPLPLSEVKIDFSILSEIKGDVQETLDVLLVAAPINLIKKYTKIIELAGLELLSIETEIISAARSLAQNISATTTAAVLNFGSETTDLAIIKNNQVYYTYSISIGGEVITSAIVQNLNLEQAQAEEYKKSYGLDKEKLQGKVYSATVSIIDKIINEIKRAFSYYNEKYPDDKIDTLILCGGASYLPSLVSYLTDRLNLETQIGNPWLILGKNSQIPQVFQNKAALFAVAVGLAMRF